MCFCLHGTELTMRTVPSQLVWCVITLISIRRTSANLINSQDNHRRARSLVGDMNIGNQPGAGGMQGVNVGPGDGMRNPQKPQLESIYRGKVVWGNVTEGGALNEEVVFGKGRLADEETDKFGNPLRTPRRGPRPQIKPQREEAHEGARQRRSVDDPLRPNIELKTDHLDSEQRRKYHEFRAQNDDIMRLIDDNLDQSINTVIKKAEQQRLVRKRSVSQQAANLKPKETVDQQQALAFHLIDRSPFGHIAKSPFEYEMIAQNPFGDEKVKSTFEKKMIKSHSEDNVEKNHFEDKIVKSHFENKNVKSPFEKENLKSPFEDNCAHQGPLDDGNPEKVHAIQKRDVAYQSGDGPKIEALHKGPVIESCYRGPVIRAQYMGPQIRSQYMGPQIRSQYMGPQIVSEYKGKMIGMLGGLKAYEASVQAAAATSTPAVVNLAPKYDRMNQEYRLQRLMAYVRNKPKLAEIFRSR